MLLRVSLEDSFEVRNVNDVYDGKIPFEFHEVIAEQKCPTTSQPIKQRNPDQMVLVAVGRRLPKN